MKNLWRFIWQNTKGLLLLAVGTSLISGLSRAALLAAVHAGLSRESARLSPWAYAGLCLTAPVFSVLADTVCIRAVNNMMALLLVTLVRQVLRIPLRQIEEIGAHRIQSTLTDDVATVTGTLRLIPTVVLQTAILAGCMVYLAWLSIPVFIGSCVFMGLFVVSVLVAQRLGRPHADLARSSRDGIFKQIQVLTAGIKELKLHQRRQRAFIGDVLVPIADAYKQHSVAGNTIYSAAGNTMQLLFFILMGLLLFFGAGWLGVSPHVVTGYGLTFLFLMGPLATLTGTIAGLDGMLASFRRLERIGLTIMTAGKEEEADAATTVEDEWTHLEFEGVTHSYRSADAEDTFTLGPLTLTLERGELLFVTGGNGSGKTTLAKLLCGLYVPEQGEIRIHSGTRIAADSAQRRQLFSVVFSDYFLFDTLLGLDGAELERATAHYLKKLQLEGKVSVKDGAFSSTALSQGQRKRLALLTACLEDRQICIFDEWAADQDPAFKRVFYREMLPWLKDAGKTVVVISHDDRFYDAAERIVKLEAGRIVEDIRPRLEVAALLQEKGVNV